VKYFLTIAASDNSGGAGIQQDLKIASLFGFWGLSAITGLTVQDFSGVDSVSPVRAEVLREQIEKCFGNFDVTTVKIGAICSAGNMEMISDCLEKYSPKNVVLDTVFASSSGKIFLNRDDIDILWERILPLVTIVKPNRFELELISGRKLEDINMAKEIANDLSCQYNCAFYISGGHFSGDQINEILIEKDTVYQVNKNRKKWSYTHGTGCTLTSAIACYLGQGNSLAISCKLATEFVTEFYDKIEYSSKFGKVC
jgi:hydroxymethylpyrimidine/phosphomethylpyrimidine kinase